MIEALISGGVANKTIDTICSKLASAVGKKCKQYQASKVAPDLFDRIHELDTVRTLFHDSPVSITSFYYPSPISHSTTREVKHLRTAADVDELKNTVITGTLGQGKSVLMRWICLLEAKEGKKVPVFIELRKIDEQVTIMDLLLQALNLLGFRGIDADTASYLLEEGFVSVYADGFDEVKREYALRTQSEIHVLTTQHRETRWVISARPGSLSNHLHSIPRLATYELMPLGESDLRPFLERILSDHRLRENLISQLSGTSTSIKGLLTTPLMVTLLAALFKRSNGIPASIHDFYLQLFQVAAWHHDGLKPSYVRERATSLSTSELQDVFETFAFLSKEHGVSLSDSQFTTCARKSASFTKKEFGPEGLKTELTEGVCLMTKDGLKTAFVHRGIQEFFAASFIKSQTDPDTVEKIYRKMRGSRLQQWTQEISFLKHIDQIRYLKYLFLPAAEETLSLVNYSPVGRSRVTKTDVISALKTMLHGIYVGGTGGAFRWIFVLNADSPHYNVISDTFFGSTDAPVAALTHEARDRIFKGEEESRLMSVGAFIRKDKAFIGKYMRGISERGIALHSAVQRGLKEVETRKTDVRSILFDD